MYGEKNDKTGEKNKQTKKQKRKWEAKTENNLLPFIC